VPNFASDILVNVVRTEVMLISISFSSLILIFVLVLVSSMITQNVFVIFIVVDERTLLMNLITHPKLGQSDLLYGSESSVEIVSVNTHLQASWVSRPTGCLLSIQP